MYFASLEASMELAKVEGPYSTYEGSPMSRGIIQPGEGQRERARERERERGTERVVWTTPSLPFPPLTPVNIP
jgi:hypothetical protein